MNLLGLLLSILALTLSVVNIWRRFRREQPDDTEMFIVIGLIGLSGTVFFAREIYLVGIFGVP